MKCNMRLLTSMPVPCACSHRILFMSRDVLICKLTNVREVLMCEMVNIRDVLFCKLVNVRDVQMFELTNVREVLVYELVNIRDVLMCELTQDIMKSLDSPGPSHGRQSRVSLVSLSVCLSVCLQHNSNTNDCKLFKFGVGNDLGIS